MGRWTHIVPAACLAAALQAGPVAADRLDDPLRFFANCVGRLSAELSHQWILYDPAASETEALRRSMIAILMALTPEGGGAHVLNLRVEARAAHAALRTRGTYRAEAWATERANNEIAHCASAVVIPDTEIATVPAGGPAPASLPARLSDN